MEDTKQTGATSPTAEQLKTVFGDTSGHTVPMQDVMPSNQGYRVGDPHPTYTPRQQR